MKWLIVIGLMVGALPLHARLGENTEELKKRFGAPVKQLKQPGQSDLAQNHYLNHDILIIVTVYNNRSVLEHYLKLKTPPANGEAPVVVPLPGELSMAILQACSGGFQWKQVSESANDVRFARDDKGALAVLIKKENVPVELRVCDINFVERLIPPSGGK